MVTLQSLPIRLCLIFLCVSMASWCYAQKIVRIDSYAVRYEPGVVLVKFAEHVAVPLGREGRLGKVALDNIRATLAKYGIEQGERLFPLAKRGEKLGKVRSFSGEEREAASLYNIFNFRCDPKHDPKTVAEELARQEGVIYAEPDYIFTALETLPNDALYSQQWYLPEINAPAAWDTTTGDTTQIIGIIDTGVDWDHSDLDDKMKINWIEYDGATGVDDDGNGYVDDIRGWDFVNSDNDPNDDNSHGTHVAGIAAAETNNGTGIAGVSWSAKILPVKVLQSTGYGSASTIALGVTYAANRGATVLNLSLGSYSESATLKTALENAYSTAVIVAAAGNDGLKIEDAFGKPMFPACYGWVIGVEATQQSGSRATFSNYDPSGPVAYNNDNDYNYELKAPGVSIHSTLPNGLYGNLSGTSMATPVVSGAVALLKTQQPTISTELLLGNLIHGLGNTMDIVAAMQQSPQPDLRYISYTLVDTLPGCDNDDRPDAGETVEIWLTVKNAWGQADSVWSKLRLDPLEDPAVASVIDSTSFIINGLSAYASATGETDPFQVQLASGLVNNRQIVFNYEIGCKNGGIQITGEVILTIQKGTEVGGLIETNTIWTSDKMYIVVDNIRIAENVTLTIQHGTEIKLDANKSIEVKGYIKCRGKVDNLIKFTKNGDNPWSKIIISPPSSSDSCIFEYCEFEGFKSWGIDANENPLQYIILRNCIFKNNNDGICIKFSLSQSGSKKRIINKNVFLNNFNNTIFETNLYQAYDDKLEICYNNIINNSRESMYNIASTLSYSWHPYKILFRGNNIFNNYGINNDEISLSISGNLSFADVSDNYWGSLDSTNIKETFFDFYDNASFPIAKFWPYLTQPSDSAHGIVWKVLVNGQNPQEETLDPIGMETVRFDVYFNRAMDIAYAPLATFGVRDPFTQHVVEDNTGWSSDSTIWHGYFTVGLETGDGINTIRVSGAKDTDHFEIPIENRRFQFTIDAAGSAANEFIATIGVGKVELEWPTASSDDVLGYNMYRIMQLTDSTFTDTTRINTTLVTDTTYTDFAVIPDSTYRYAYKVLGTDMAESDYSKFITATPVNAASGDANGDLSVNVLDIVAIVNYILEENPQPFLFEAADVNNDGSVNVLDIVGVVNIILGMPKATLASVSEGEANLVLTPEGLKLVSTASVAGLQFMISGEEIGKVLLVPTDALDGMEIAKREAGEKLIFVVYNLRGMTLPVGERILFRLEGKKKLVLESGIACNQKGVAIPLSLEQGAVIPNNYELSQNYPNPFNPVTTFRYGLPKAGDVTLTIFNLLGQRVKTFDEGFKEAGYHKVIWDGGNEMGVHVATGVYFYQLKVNQITKAGKMLLLR